MEETDLLVEHDLVHREETPGEPILRTKLYRPLVAADMVPRPRLVDLLEAGRHRPLTLISAAAGYGKSTLASQWLETTDCPSGWVSLDKGDNDPRLFLTFLLAAIQELYPELRLKTQSLLQTPELPAAPTLARYLLNDLDGVAERFILVLDDYHRITQTAVHELLAELLRHPSPVLHLALLSRREPPLPLAALRGRDQVTELGMEHLCFTAAETSAFLERALGLSVDEETAARLDRKMEGWVTGLRLIALSLGQDKDVGRMLAGLEGGFYHISNYLIQEVLSHVPPDLARCLLETSVLDRFCAPLCQAVCFDFAETYSEMDAGDNGGRAFIEWLEKSHLFVIPLDGAHHWFRYHHLFQQLLQDRLKRERGPGDIAMLHQRASRWFAENDLIDEALGHALAAGDVEFAVHLVEQGRYSLMNTEQWHHLERWLKLLPAEAVAQNPMLMSTLAYVSTYRGQDPEMVNSAQQAEQLLARLPAEAPEVQIVQGEVTVIQALLDIAAGQPARAVASAQRSLELLPSQALHIRLMAVATIAVGLQMQGDLNQGVAVIREALADRALPAGMQARLFFFLSIAYFQEGDLAGVLGSSRECLRIAENLQLVESENFARYFLGISHYLRDEFAQAEPYLLALLEDRGVSAPNYLANGVFALALIRHAQGRMAEAAQVIDLVSAHFRETKDTVALALTEAFGVELALRQGKLAEAHRLSKSVEFDVRPPMWFFFVPQITPIKLLLAEGTDQSLAEARARLDAFDEAMRVINRNNVRIDALALQALVCDALGDEPAAMEKLDVALALGEPGGFIRTFVDLGAPMADLLLRLQEQEAGQGYTDYIHCILAAFPDAVRPAEKSELAPTGLGYQPPNGSLSEPLTRRELQILKLLSTGLSRQEIAAKLVIAPGTVHTHTKNIYGKLDVRNRLQAVQRARELGLF